MRDFRTDIIHVAGQSLPVLYQKKRMKHMYLRVKELPQSGETLAALGPVLQTLADAGQPAPRFFVSVTLARRMSWTAAKEFVASRNDWIKDRLTRAQKNATPPLTQAEKRAAKAKLQPIIERLLRKWCPVIGVAPQKVTYRQMKTRWGSCSQRTGNLSFNLQLLDYPEEVIEYVVVHELCHFLEPNHGPGFWREVERHVPDWRQRRRALR